MNDSLPRATQAELYVPVDSESAKRIVAPEDDGPTPEIYDTLVGVTSYAIHTLQDGEVVAEQSFVRPTTVIRYRHCVVQDGADLDCLKWLDDAGEVQMDAIGPGYPVTYAQDPDVAGPCGTARLAPHAL